MSWRARWPQLRRLLIAGFFLVAAALLWRYARLVDWAAVAAAIADYPGPQLALAATVSLVAYALYCTLDLLARDYTGHRLRRMRVYAIAFVSYAFNLNLGGMVGGIGFRYRLYWRAGLDVPTISRVIAFVIAGNWSGYLLLGGLALAFNPLPLPPAWEVGAPAVRIAGFGMLAGQAAWLALCAFSPRRSWRVRGHLIELPSLNIALRQLLVASASWLAITTILFVLLPAGTGYLTIGGVLALSVLANLIVRIPANLGVLEAVFVGMLGAQVPAPQVLAALLTYRAMFHIGPLLLALGILLRLEMRPTPRAPSP